MQQDRVIQQFVVSPWTTGVIGVGHVLGAQWDESRGIVVHVETVLGAATRQAVAHPGYGPLPDGYAHVVSVETAADPVGQRIMWHVYAEQV